MARGVQWLPVLLKQLTKRGVVTHDACRSMEKVRPLRTAVHTHLLGWLLDICEPLDSSVAIVRPPRQKTSPTLCSRCTRPEALTDVREIRRMAPSIPKTDTRHAIPVRMPSGYSLHRRTVDIERADP